MSIDADTNKNAGNGTDETTPPAGAPAAPAAKEPRKPVAPTFVWIGTREGDTFKILKELPDGPSDADVRAEVKKLPFGTYTIIRGRDTVAVYEECKSTKLTL